MGNEGRRQVAGTGRAEMAPCSDNDFAFLFEDALEGNSFLLELQKSDGAPSGYMISKADMMKKIEAKFDKMDTGKKGMLDKKQADAFLRELMKSGS